MVYSVVNVIDNLYRIERVSSYHLNRKGKVFNSYIEAELYVKNNGFLYSDKKYKNTKRPFSSNKNMKNIW